MKRHLDTLGGSAYATDGPTERVVQVCLPLTYATAALLTHKIKNTL